MVALAEVGSVLSYSQTGVGKQNSKGGQVGAGVSGGCMAARWAVVGIVQYSPPGQGAVVGWAEADYTGGWSVWDTL